jgi:hypothetical protein
MKRTTMLLGAACAALALTACGGGVDREGTRDELIDQLEQAGIEADGDCIDGVLDEYSDDELEDIDSTLEDGGSTAASEELLTKLLDCTNVGG